MNVFQTSELRIAPGVGGAHNVLHVGQSGNFLLFFFSMVLRLHFSSLNIILLLPIKKKKINKDSPVCFAIAQPTGYGLLNADVSPYC